MKNILPFDEFWYDCFVNSRITYMDSINSTYHNMMYINDYKYSIHNFEGIEDDYLAIEFLVNNQSKLFLSNLRICEKNYKDQFNFMQEINELVISGSMVCPKVDLFIWNKWGSGYQKWKSYHYTTLVGYCSPKKEYLALEDDRHGKYRIISQAEEDLERAINSIRKWCNKGRDYLIFDCDTTIPDYTCGLVNIITNIEQINESIENVMNEEFFCFTEEINQIPRNMEFQAITISKIVTKMEVNRVFMKILYDKKILDDPIYRKVDILFLELKNSYEIMKNILLKCRDKVIIEFVKKEGIWLNARLKCNLRCEYDIWSMVENKIRTIDENMTIL